MEQMRLLHSIDVKFALLPASDKATNKNCFHLFSNFRLQISASLAHLSHKTLQTHFRKSSGTLSIPKQQLST